MDYKLILIPLSIYLLSGCSSPTMSEYQYNPLYQQVQKIDYSNYYELTPIQLDPGMENTLELFLVTQLDNQEIPGEYSLRTISGYLDTRHYIVDARATLYLHNKSDQPKQVELKAISLEHQRLPLSGQRFHLPGKKTLSWSLGSVPVDMRLHRINTRIEYLFNGQHTETNYQQQRMTQQQARQEFRGLQIPNSL